jgi:hypothetical protein
VVGLRGESTPLLDKEGVGGGWLETNAQAGMPAHGSWRAALPQLFAAILICNLASLAQQAPGNPGAVRIDDEGVFEISVGGRPVGSESFRIHSSATGVEARGEIHLNVQQNGKMVNFRSFPDLVLDSQLHPLTYKWSQQGAQSSRLEVDFRSIPARVRYKTVNGSEDDRTFQLPPDVAVLDDNVIHHFQLIVARFEAMGGGKQTLPVFVPQEALPSVLTIEEMKNGEEPADAHLRQLVITTDVTQLALWIDDEQHLQRVVLPAAQLEALRKK